MIKAFKRLVLVSFQPLAKPSLDPLEFAYQPNVRVNDAIIYLLHFAYTHLDRPGSATRIVFFSRALNTTLPALLRKKINVMHVDAPLVSWIMDYLIGCPKHVHTRSLRTLH